MNPLFIGIKGRVLAIDRASGNILWETRLSVSQFVNIHREGSALFAATRGELFCLDPVTGALRWGNKLPGLGRGLLTFEGDGRNTTAMARQLEDDERAASTTSMGGASPGCQNYLPKSRDQDSHVQGRAWVMTHNRRTTKILGILIRNSKSGAEPSSSHLNSSISVKSFVIQCKPSVEQSRPTA